MTDFHRGIVTPEAVVLEFETAAAGSRFLAFIVDVLIQLVAGSMALGFISGAAAAAMGETAAAIVGMVGAFMVVFGYPTLFETFNRGRTPGKAMGNLRVVTTEGGPVRFRHAALRSVFSVVEIFLTFGTLALTSMMLTRDNQRLGDVFAGTIVLREKTGSAPAIAVRFPAPVGYEDYLVSLDTSAVTRDEYLVIRRFLMRVNELTPEARAGLAVSLARPVAERMHHTPPADLGPELFLAVVASAYQLRNGAPPLPWERIPGYSMPIPPPPPPAVAGVGVGVPRFAAAPPAPPAPPPR